MRILCTSVAALVLIAVGCTPGAKAPPAASLQAIQISQAPAPPEQEYKIQVGDQLDIKFLGHSGYGGGI
jgi:protein involved in polysaccharide export with SLBB domain